VTKEAAVFCANLFVAKVVKSPVVPTCVPDIKDDGSVVNIQCASRHTTIGRK
jgi:hypothetical protein